MSLRLRLALFVLLILIAIISLSIYGSNSQNKILIKMNQIHETSSNLIHLTEQLDNNFQKQLLAWTNLLLRGQEPTEYHFYLQNFYTQERKTRSEVKLLSSKLNDYIFAKQSANNFISAHNELGFKFRKALKIFNQSTTPAYDADQFIWGSVAIPTDLLSLIKNDILSQQKILIAETKTSLTREKDILLYTSIFFILLFLILFIWILDISIGRPLSKTTTVAKNISNGDFSQRVSENLPGEFNLFATAFNNMMDHISATNKYLNENMKTLQDEIHVREDLEKELHNKRLIAEDASRSKSEFLSTMSHEIRTPLNIIIGYLELLNLTELTDEQQNYLQSVQSGSSSLLSIINDVLDFAKIEAGKLNIEYNILSLSDLTNEINHMFFLPAETKNIKFTITISDNVPKGIISDFTRLKQILVNLISNAIKFTEKGFVKLSIDATPTNDPSRVNLTFSVEDSGIGIHEKYLEKIFNHFEQQSGQDARKFGGTGLGLAICDKLSLLLNGKLSVTSLADKGSTFTLHIYEVEISRETSTSNSQSEKPRLLLNAATILIADDIKSNRQLIKDCLRSQPIEFIEAENGKEAIALAKENKPDLILMDIKMPEMDGIEATTILRADEELKNIPVIALSASSVHEDNTELKETLFNDYLTKPLKLRLLIEKMDHHLKS